jgi:hypothetical protein
MSYSIFTWSFQHFNTSINVIHIFVNINITRRPFNLHMAFFNLGFNTRVRIIDMIMTMWILFRSKKQVYLPFEGTKDLLIFHVCNYNYEGLAQGMFQNCFYKLLWVTKLCCFMKKKFIPIKPLSGSTTFLEVIIQCGLFESSNIIIRCCNKQTPLSLIVEAICYALFLIGYK